jgi:hypothetical protein
VFDLPTEGGDPPFISDTSVKQALTYVAACLFPDDPKLKSVKIHPTKLADQIVKYHDHGDQPLDEDFCTRMFFMVLNNTILTPNTSSYIKNNDAKWCENLKAIAGYNWCKIVFDNLLDTDHQWKLCRRLKKDKPPILGCNIFLIVSHCNHPTTFQLILGHDYYVGIINFNIVNLIPFIICGHRFTILTT